MSAHYNRDITVHEFGRPSVTWSVYGNYFCLLTAVYHVLHVIRMSHVNAVMYLLQFCMCM